MDNVIITRPDWVENGELEYESLDIENGDQNDFEIVLPKNMFNGTVHRNGSLIFIPGTEWGGIIKTIHPSGDTLYLNGPTWRGRLDKIIVKPPAGEDHLVVSGDANAVIRQLLKREGMEGLFIAPSINSGITVTNYKFPRYYSLLDGINSMLASRDGKLRFRYNRGAANKVGYVEVSAVRVRDYSDAVEINNDMEVKYDILVDYFGVNHLICLGQGKLKDRLAVDLYVDAAGNVSETQTFFGLAEVAEVYELSSEEDRDKLKSDGISKLKEMLKTNQCRASLTSDIDIDIGDIISGRERVTGVKIRTPVERKILTIQEGVEKIEYKLKGE